MATAKTANPKKQRYDTLVRLVDGSSVIIDTTVALVNAAAHPSAADKEGVVSEKRVAHKNAKYNAAWDLHGNVTLVVAAIETSGRWSSGFTDEGIRLPAQGRRAARLRRAAALHGSRDPRDEPPRQDVPEPQGLNEHFAAANLDNF